MSYEQFLFQLICQHLNRFHVKKQYWQNVTSDSYWTLCTFYTGSFGRQIPFISGRLVLFGNWVLPVKTEQFSVHRHYSTCLLAMSSYSFGLNGMIITVLVHVQSVTMSKKGLHIVSKSNRMAQMRVLRKYGEKMKKWMYDGWKNTHSILKRSCVIMYSTFIMHSIHEYMHCAVLFNIVMYII